MRILMVFLGGGIGSCLRYGLSLLRLDARQLFPWQTLLANLLGCLLIGIFSGLGSGSWQLPEELRLALVTGLCGGFTTYSTFSAESLRLFSSGHWALALCYVLLSLVLGLVFVFLGLLLARRLAA